MHLATEMTTWVRLKMIFHGMFATNEIKVTELAGGNWEIIARGEKYYATQDDDHIYIYYVDGEEEIEVLTFTV